MSEPTLPEDVLVRMGVPGYPDTYVLGCHEIKQTIYSQQVRALNLVHSLKNTGRLPNGFHVCIIGAGIAGVTAAIAAVHLGATVTVLEQYNEPLTINGRCIDRYLHPYLYDWHVIEDRKTSATASADLPILEWKAGTADRVTSNMLKQYREHELEFTSDGRLKFYGGATIKSIWNESGQVNISWNDRNKIKNETSSQVLILAIGFGLEKHEAPTTDRLYWDNDNLGRPSLRHPAEPRQFLVSGTGDGGLIDLMRIRILDFRHEGILRDLSRSIGTKKLESVRDTLKQIERDVAQFETGQLSGAEAEKASRAFLYENYMKLAKEVLADNANLGGRLRLRKDTAAVLSCTHEFPFRRSSSTLNRFMVAILLLCDSDQTSFIGLQEKVTQLAEGGYLVQFRPPSEPRQKTFDDIVNRHGPIHGDTTCNNIMQAHRLHVKNRVGDEPTKVRMFGDTFNAATPSLLIGKTVSFQSIEATYYVSVDKDRPGNYLRAGFAKRPGKSERFTVVDGANGNVRLKSHLTNTYVACDPETKILFAPNAPTADDYCEFEWVRTGGNNVILRHAKTAQNVKCDISDGGALKADSQNSQSCEKLHVRWYL